MSVICMRSPKEISISGEAFESCADEERNVSSDSEASTGFLLKCDSTRVSAKETNTETLYSTVIQVKAEREAPDDLAELQKYTEEAA